MKIDGKEIALKIIKELKSKEGTSKTLAAILIGESVASKSFIKQKEKVAKELGIEFQFRQFGSDIGEVNLIREIEKLNDDEKVGGIIIQLPLPPEFNRDKIIAFLNPEKDADALNLKSNLVLPPAVEVVEDILRTMSYDLRTKVVAVVGSKGFLVGRPISGWLAGKCKKLIALDMGGDLSAIKEADLVITGVGKAGIIKPEMLKSGAVVIDFGYDMQDGKISGDFDTDKCRVSGVKCRVSFYTPVPGGTGPILVAELFKNFYRLLKLIKD